MSRPITFDDLPDYYRNGHVVASIPTGYITRYPSLGQHLLAALAEADRLGLSLVGDDIVIPLTDDELSSNLRQVQRNWDAGNAWYEEAMVSGSVTPDYRRYSVTSFAREEGRPVPTFDEDGHATFPATSEAVAR